ncbi:MAG: trigger factor family protein, partial [Candidatus Dormibacteraceae bacterium]
MSTSELQIDTENLPGSLIGVQIEVPSPEVDRAFDRVLTRLQQRVKIEGFRPGKAPRALVEARLGSGAVREEAIDLLVPEVVSQALREKSISAIDNPKVEIAEFERGRPARFTARVTVLPPVTLPDLDQIQVARPATEVDDKLVEDRITALR